MSSAFDHQLHAAYLRLLRRYAVWGGHRYFGWTEQAEPRNYLGPLVWSEADCALRFAVELEKEFPEQVHLEFPLAQWTLTDYDPARDKKQFVDLVVSDFGAFEAHEVAQAAFMSKRHDLFVEVKYFKKQAHGPWKFDLKKKLPWVVADIERLARHLERGHCRRAAMLILDDGDYLQAEGHSIDFGPVIGLIVSPYHMALHLDEDRGDEGPTVMKSLDEWESLGMPDEAFLKQLRERGKNSDAALHSDMLNAGEEEQLLRRMREERADSRNSGSAGIAVHGDGGW